MKKYAVLLLIASGAFCLGFSGKTFITKQTTNNMKKLPASAASSLSAKTLKQ